MSPHTISWTHRGSDTRRWAFFAIGAQMRAIDGLPVHGPNPRCTCRPSSLGFCAGCVGVDFMVHGMRGAR